MAFTAGTLPPRQRQQAPQAPLNPLLANPNGPTATNARNEISAGARGATEAAGRLGSGQFTSSPFAQAFFQKFNNPQGFTPAAFQAHRNQVDRTATTGLSQRINDLRNQASARGNTASLPLAEAMLSAQSGADVQGSLDNFLIESERAGQQNSSSMAGVLAQILGLEQQQNQGFANLQLNRTFQGAPGVDPTTGEQTGPQYEFLNEQGQMNRSPTTPEEWARFYNERRTYEQGLGRTLPASDFF